MTTRGSLRIHPMIIDGPITCFSSFHNVNCPKGFLYFNKQVCQLYLAVSCTSTNRYVICPKRFLVLQQTGMYSVLRYFLYFNKQVMPSVLSGFWYFQSMTLGFGTYKPFGPVHMRTLLTRMHIHWSESKLTKSNIERK